MTSTVSFQPLVDEVPRARGVARAGLRQHLPPDDPKLYAVDVHMGYAIIPIEASFANSHISVVPSVTGSSLTVAFISELRPFRVYSIMPMARRKVRGLPALRASSFRPVGRARGVRAARSLTVGRVQRAP